MTRERGRGEFGGNLTVMLVSTTLFIRWVFFGLIFFVYSVLYSVSFSVMEKLPPTSYVRLVDIWLINGQLVPFLEVILLTVLELKREGTSAINHHGFKRLTEIKLNSLVMYWKFYKYDYIINQSYVSCLSWLVFGILSSYELGKRDFFSRDVSQSRSKEAFNDVGKTSKLVRCLEITEEIILPITILIFSVIYWTYASIVYFGWRMKWMSNL